ncbi:unnamed protein product [Alopecurus aequalis]
MASSSLLPPATFAKRYHSLLHPHGTKNRLIRCGAASTDGAVPDELLSSALHLGKSATPVATVVSDTGTDGWGDLLNELKRSLQADLDQATGNVTIGGGELLSSPSVNDAANAVSSIAVPEDVLKRAAETSAGLVSVSGEAATNGGIPDELLGALHLDASKPAVRLAGGALTRLEELTVGLPEAERWALFGFVAITWLYLTARPGVLGGAVDTYVFAPLQLALDTVLGRRSLKMSDFVVGERIGEGSFGVKLIDFGAATDLRIGKNYVPDRTLLDPDYCPPELYVLPEETPTPPAEPIAAILSPILWQLNSPDLFDMYSAGIVLMQMAIPGLRSPSGLKNFNSELKAAGYDLNRWRETTRRRPDLQILDLDSGRGWDLATKLIAQREQGRLSAAAALRHPYFLLGGDRAAAVLSKLQLSK